MSKLYKLILKFLLHLDNLLYHIISRVAIKYDGGIHPKHRLTDYHDFFVKNVKEGEVVLDVGCGTGEVTCDVAIRSKPKLIIGIDLNGRAISLARKRYESKCSNLKFIYGKAPEDVPEQPFDTLILSNVLEHQKDRVGFLKELLTKTECAKVLIRVPLFERDWRLPLKKELGVGYFSDPTHHIEYTLEEFVEEVSDAGLKIKSLTSKWGEIWAVCMPASRKNHLSN